jgi:NAD+ kinase
MKVIGLISNNKNNRAINITKEIHDYLLSRNIRVNLLSGDSMPLKYHLPGSGRDDFDLNSEAIISVGGDGTFLRAARHSFKNQVPVMGINVGKLGFLAETEIKDYKTSIDNLLKGSFKIEDRMLIEVKIKREDKVVEIAEDPLLALNEFVVSRVPAGKILDFSLIANEYEFMKFRSDGIIVSTPTGSTAYSLSAGGPIVEPANQSIIFTPLNAHSLFSRSIVTSPAVNIKVILGTKNKGDSLNADGIKIDVELKSGDVFEFSKSTSYLKLITMGSNVFFRVFREKLIK